MARIDDRQQVITLSASRILSFDPDNGHLLWDYAFANNRENNVADVIVSNGLVYASSGYGKGSILLQPKQQADGKFHCRTGMDKRAPGQPSRRRAARGW